MKIIKLDRRYAHSKKFNYALQFTNPKPKRDKSHIPYYRAFSKAFGQENELNPNSNSIWSRNYYIWNENWYYDSKHNRICFKNESDLTAALLYLES